MEGGGGVLDKKEVQGRGEEKLWGKRGGERGELEDVVSKGVEIGVL